MLKYTQPSGRSSLGGRLEERTNEQWIADLSAAGESQSDALQDLRAIVLKGLPYALTKWLSPGDPHFDALAEEVAQDTMLRVLDNLHSFEGRSKFTTWVHKIAVRIALTELRRKRWKDVSIDEMTETVEGASDIFADIAAGPEIQAEQSEAIDRIRRIIVEELTEKQKKALVATQINGAPIEEVAARMDMNRNAMYKLLHDARKRLKRRLGEEGLSPDDVFKAFETG
jgi:RNA polymerase sigma-70 factor (ECF subfamily)